MLGPFKDAAQLYMRIEPNLSRLIILWLVQYFFPLVFACLYPSCEPVNTPQTTGLHISPWFHGVQRCHDCPCPDKQSIFIYSKWDKAVIAGSLSPGTPRKTRRKTVEVVNNAGSVSRCSTQDSRTGSLAGSAQTQGASQARHGRPTASQARRRTWHFTWHHMASMCFPRVLGAPRCPSL